MAPPPAEVEWALTDADVREWRGAYTAEATRRRKQAASDRPEQAAGSDEYPTAEHSYELKQHVLVSWGNGITRARLLRGTTSVLLLDGEKPHGNPLAPGAPLRIGLPGTPRMLRARLAAHVQGNMFLVSLGSRAVRGASRARVDLPAVVRVP